MFCFRHIQTNWYIIQGSAHTYSEPCISLVYSKPRHIPVTKHIQTPRCIHNAILNIFTKAASWAFDTVLSAPSRITLLLSLTLHFRNIHPYLRLIQSYLVLSWKLALGMSLITFLAFLLFHSIFNHYTFFNKGAL